MTSSQSIPVASLARACLDGRPFAWQALVDECASTVVELIGDFDRLTGTDRTPQSLNDMVARVFESLRADNLAALRDIPHETNGRIFLGIIVRRSLHEHSHAVPAGAAVPSAPSSAGGQG